MNLARVIGTVWATKKDPGFEGARIQIIQPLTGDLKPFGMPIAAVDTVQACQGEVVFYVTAREAIIAMKRDLNDLTPVDAAIVGIVERIRGEYP